MSKLHRRRIAGEADARRFHWPMFLAKFLWAVLAILLWRAAYSLGGGDFSQAVAFYGWICLGPVVFLAWIAWRSMPPKRRP